MTKQVEQKTGAFLKGPQNLIYEIRDPDYTDSTYEGQAIHIGQLWINKEACRVWMCVSLREMDEQIIVIYRELTLRHQEMVLAPKKNVWPKEKK